jgi:hypothetical protein
MTVSDDHPYTIAQNGGQTEELQTPLCCPLPGCNLPNYYPRPGLGLTPGRRFAAWLGEKQRISGQFIITQLNFRVNQHYLFFMKDVLTKDATTARRIVILSIKNLYELCYSKYSIQII